MIDYLCYFLSKLVYTTLKGDISRNNVFQFIYLN